MVLQSILRRDFLETLGLALWGLTEAWGASGSSAAKISEIETIALKDADKYDLTLVRVRTDVGIDGLGQAESPSLVIDSIIKTTEGLENLLKGEDPLQVERLWQKMYSATGLWGRRGVTVAAIGAVETALWDIAGKILNKPICELIWRSFAATREEAEVKTRVRPYATVWFPGDTEKEIRERFGMAVQAGFQAVKFEERPGGFGHVDSRTDARLVQLIREIIGPDRDLMLDVQNCWVEAGQAIATCRAIAPYNVYFVEAPLPPDNLEAYKRLAEATDIRIAAGDWGFTTRFDYIDLMEKGGIDVVQPSTVRSGGMAEITKIAEMAYRKGLLCIPHSWNAMIGVAAAVHLAAVLPNMPYIEYPIAIPHSPLITDLLVPELKPNATGWIEVPRRPGLGFTLNEDVVKRYRVKPS